MKPKSFALAIGLYLVSTGASFGAFNFINRNSSIAAPDKPALIEGRLTIDPSAPKTAECPLNGEMFTEVEHESWKLRRPLLVMIENHPESRPQSGLGSADVVYESIAEGGVTRFMGAYYCAAQADDVLLAPVRSARTQFVNWATEYGKFPLYVHVGGANCSADKYPDGGQGPCKTDKRVQALEQIQQYGWGGRTGNDMNQFSIGFPTFYRDYNRLTHDVATEHTMVSSTESLWALALERGWSNLDPDGDDWTDFFQPWKFSDEEGSAGTVTSIAYDFWNGFNQFNVGWELESATGLYRRSNGGQPHLDLNTGSQLAYKTVIVQFVKEIAPVDELKHVYYETMGAGDALIFSSGQVQQAKWAKKTRLDRTVFTDNQGKELVFARGPIWISIVSPDTDIAY